MNRSRYLTPDWPVARNVHCLVTTRQSSNLALHVEDDPGVVKLNRKRLLKDLDGVPIQWLQQVHGTEVFVAQSSDVTRTPIADAIYSRELNKACAVLTADCLPILLSDKNGQEVAVVHAGWRGLLAGVIENTIACFNADTENIMVYLGPAIGPCHFEVGEEVRRAFLENTTQKKSEARTDYSCAFTPSSNSPSDGSKWMADLYRLARLKLLAAGVTQIYGGERCTYCDDQEFYSYRRNNSTGRFASIIWLT